VLIAVILLAAGCVSSRPESPFGLTDRDVFLDDSEAGIEKEPLRDTDTIEGEEPGAATGESEPFDTGEAGTSEFADEGPIDYGKYDEGEDSSTYRTSLREKSKRPLGVGLGFRKLFPFRYSSGWVLDVRLSFGEGKAEFFDLGLGYGEVCNTKPDRTLGKGAYHMIPVFGQYRWNVADDGFSWYWAAGGGLSFSRFSIDKDWLIRHEMEKGYVDYSESAKVGISAHFECGPHYAVSRDLELNLGLGLRLYRAKHVHDYEIMTMVGNRQDIRNLVLDGVYAILGVQYYF
jgi:hypothetical protein